MKSFLLSTLCLIVSSAVLPAQVGQDIKNLGHDTKTATEAGAKKTKNGTKKAYHSSKHAVKKGAHKTATATEKGADKVADKTETDTAK